VEQTMPELEFVDEEDLAGITEAGEDKASSKVIDSGKLTKIQSHMKSKKREIFTVASSSHIEIGEENIIKTGSYNLDCALGIGGLPKGRIVEIFGVESTGKSTLCLSVIANAQKMGYVCAMIDAEHAFSVTMAENVGVDLETLLLMQPDSAEDAFDTLFELIDAGIDVVLIDSVAALVPRKELDGEAGDVTIGLQARLMSKELRKLATVGAKHNVLTMFVNQIREKVGVLYGNPETTPGGKALKFYASIRLDVRKKETLKDGDIPIGINTKVTVIKNKVAAPFKIAEYRLLFASGIDKQNEYFDLFLANGIIEQNNKTYTFLGEKIAIGQEKAREWVAANLDRVEAHGKEVGLF